MRRSRFLVLLCSLAMVALLAIVPGCSTPADPYVKADRATYNAIAPTLVGLVDGTIAPADIDADEKSLIHDTLSTWDARIRHAEQAATQPASGP